MSRLPPVSGAGRSRRIVLVAGLALGQALCTGVAAFATRDVFAAFGAPASPLPFHAAALVAAAGLTLAILRIGERVEAERLGQDYAAALRIRLFTHLTRLAASDIAHRRVGYLTLRFVGDLTAVKGWISHGLTRLISSGTVLPSATGVLFLLDPRLALAAVAPLVIGLTMMASARAFLGPAHRRLRSRRARLAADLAERVPHAPELRLLGRGQRERARLRRTTQRMVRAALGRARAAAALRAVPDAVAGVGAAALMLTALWSGTPAAVTAGGLAAFGLMIRPLRDLAGTADRWHAWVAARERCEALLAAPTLDQPRGTKRAPLADTSPIVRFSHVSAVTLADVNAEAGAGAKIAVVGPNGAGKSTLIRLVAGLELPQQGRITIAGRTPVSFTAAERRRTIALVGARAPILAGSLRRALTMGVARRPADRAILAAAERFGLAAVVERLGGLDGTVAEGGRNLSAGEARRVLLTRAALSEARLLLLDEPDDALDADAPRLIAELVRSSGATTLLATHAIEIAATMDAIWFIENGRLTETGTPTAVLAGEGPAAAFFGRRTAA
ncbi:MAG: ATP-binding cassette domain-containing protein [Rhodospirillales bacterium]